MGIHLYSRFQNPDPPCNSYPIPRIGQYISVLEKVHSVRKGEQYVQNADVVVSAVTNRLVVCTKSIGNATYTLSYPINDFRHGLLIFHEINEDDYTIDVMDMHQELVINF